MKNNFRVWNCHIREFMGIHTPYNCLCNSSSEQDLIWQKSTGLLSKDGIEIFEGDICEYELLDDKNNRLDYAKGDIRFRKGSFRLDGIGYEGIESYLEDFWEDDNRTSLKIIGNIYE